VLTYNGLGHLPVASHASKYGDSKPAAYMALLAATSLNPSQAPIAAEPGGETRGTSANHDKWLRRLDCSSLVPDKSTCGAASSQGVLGPAAPEKMIGLIGGGHPAVTAPPASVRASVGVCSSCSCSSRGRGCYGSRATEGAGANLSRRRGSRLVLEP